ncbi:hypothetical protein [Actinopolymorpha alba]|uniref:hypothetical protein n=1 Tax=Actinopolymorpha alba TaxID=533267 RepID=UPI0012F6AE91|nr:hypothetical protein [Actinopolymorpha alba]
MLVLALRDDAATVIVVGALVLLGFALWWRRSPAAAAAAASLAVMFVLTSATTRWVGNRIESVSPVQLGLAFWLFGSVVVVASWLGIKNSRRNAAVTVLFAHAVLVGASVVAYLAPAVVPIMGLCLAMGVVAWCAHRDRRSGRSPDKTSTSTSDGAAHIRGVHRTQEALADLGAGWQQFGPRVLPDGRQIEDLVVGPAGVFVVATRHWEGRVELVSLGQAGSTHDEAYALDGDVKMLAVRLRPIAEAVRDITNLLGVDPEDVNGLVVFWDETELAGGLIELALIHGGTGEGGSSKAVLARGERLSDWARSQRLRLDERRMDRIGRAVSTKLPSANH